MEYNEEALEQQERFGSGEHQFIILTQLAQAAVHMQHIDEIFLWLAEKMTRHLKIEIVQIWTATFPQGEPTSIALRATAFQDASMSRHIVINTQAMQVTSQLLQDQRSKLQQPVANLFPVYQSNLFRRYGLNHYAYSSIVSNIAVPPAYNTVETTLAIGPSIISAIAYMAQPRAPQFLTMIGQILEQATFIAKRQGLFSPSYRNENSASTDRNTQRDILATIFELIPLRTRPTESMRTSNPFASVAPIPDKVALALFSAVDGSKTLAEIIRLKNISPQDAIQALRILLQQERIHLYTHDKQLIEREAVLKVI